MSDVAAALASVKRRIAVACDRCGRDPKSVTLVAVSKTQPDEAVRAVYDAGQRVFAENYADALTERRALLATLPDARVRFIGHLQRNKVRAVLDAGALVETLDSARLASEIDARAKERGRVWPVLIQVNVGGEPQKSGCAKADLGELVRHIGTLGHLALEGLMTLPPHTDDPEGARPFFRRLRELAAAHGLSSLSMGMSHDLEVAVSEGATHVRVGTAIFGERRT